MKGVSENPKCSSGPCRGQQDAVILRFRLDPGRRYTQREEMSGAGAEFFSRNDGQVRRIFSHISRGQRDIVVGDRDEGQIILFGGGHHFRHGPAAVGGFRVDVNHTDALVGAITLRGNWEFDEQSFQEDSGGRKEQNYEGSREDTA
jgi:hypothetical protein